MLLFSWCSSHSISTFDLTLRSSPQEIPHNVLILDTAVFERQLFQAGQRGNMLDPSGNPRQSGSTLSLTNFIASLGVDPRCVMHNAGNDALLSLLGLQMLLEPGETKVPTARSLSLGGAVALGARPGGGGGCPMIVNFSHEL